MPYAWSGPTQLWENTRKPQDKHLWGWAVTLMTLWRRGWILLIAILYVFPKPAFTVDPASLKVKVYGAWLSKSEYCTKPVQIFGSIDPIELNFLGNPELGSLDNTDNESNGTYKCFVIQISEAIKFIPLTTNGYCIAGIEYTTRICGAGQTTIHPETSETASCQDGSITNDTVFLYMSSASTASTLSNSSAPFLPPSQSTLSNGLYLGQALTISGSQSAKFVVDAYDRIESYGTSCRIGTPAFSFNALSN